MTRYIRERNQAQEKLQQYQRQLEEQVEKHTAELKSVNLTLEYLSRMDGLTGVSQSPIFR